jgi:localization factor PodJL
MTAAGPWSVKGIDPKAREVAKDLARRSGMTLGEWLNQMIIDGVDSDMPPPPFDDASASYGQRQGAFRSGGFRSDVREPGRRRLLDEMYREATFARDAEAELRQDAAGRRIPERGYREPSYRDSSPRGSSHRDSGDAPFRRLESGRAESERPDEAELARITQALQTLSARLETAEHRSTLAISGIDQSVMGVLSRLDGLDESQGETTARLEGAIDQVRDTQARVAERVRRMEQEDGSRVDALRALEGALSRLAGQINETTARTDAATAQVHEDVESLGRRVNRIESGADAAAALLSAAGKTREDLDAVSRRVEAVESAVAAAPDAYADAEKVETVLGRFAERLERAEARTTAAVRSLEASFADLDARLRTNEARARDTDVVGEVDRRFQSLAADLSNKVDSARAEFAERLRSMADTAKPDAARLDAAKLGALETALRDLTGQVGQVERKSAQAIDRIGKEVVTIAQSLGERIAGAEARSTTAVQHIGSEMARISDAIDSRLKRADTAQAEALEKLGGEIARIAERLTERIAASDKRSAETLDAAAGKLARLTDALSDRQDQTATELTNRIRQSEERTAKLLEDAREKLEQQAQDLQRKAMRETALRAAEAVAAPAPPAIYPVEPRPPTFPSASFPDSDGTSGWADDEMAGAALDPFESRAASEAPPAPVRHADPFASPPPEVQPGPEAPRPTEALMIDEPLMGATPASGSVSRFEANPFDPDDDFLAATPGLTTFGPPPMSFEAARPAAATGEPMAPPPEMAPFGDFSVRDFVAAPEPEKPSSTREMLDQARAAAKRASGGRDSFKLNPIPAPPLEGGETKAFGMSFNSKAKKPNGGSTLRTVGLASVWACAITSAAVGAYSLAVKDGGGQSHGLVAEAPTAATPPAEEASAEPTKPQLAVALASAPTSSPAAPADADASASAGPISKTAAALSPGVKSATAAAHLSPKPPAPASPAPAALNEKAVSPSETARSLYENSVHRIETGDTGAVSDLKRAANLGFAPAQFYLGRLYEAGAAGVGKDMTEARRWTERAAQSGDPAAMYNLASYLYAGDGGPKDPAGAVEWFRKAAERGVVNSQYNLAQLYETGHGVPKNLAEAYKWYLVAAAAGDPESKANVQTLKAQLPADARAAAERAAAALHGPPDGPAHLATAPSAALPH